MVNDKLPEESEAVLSSGKPGRWGAGAFLKHCPYEDTQFVILDNQASHRRPVPIRVSRACLRQQADRKNGADVLYEGPD